MSGVPLVIEPGISLIVLPLMRILQRLHTLQTHSSSFLTQRTYFCSNFVCNIFSGVRTIKEMPGSVASGTSGILYKFDNTRRDGVHLSLKKILLVFARN